MVAAQRPLLIVLAALVGSARPFSVGPARPRVAFSRVAMSSVGRDTAVKTVSPPSSATQAAATIVEAAGEAVARGAAAKAAQAAPAPAKQGKKGKKGGRAGPGQPLVIGLSHHTATVEVREKLAVPEAEWNNASAALLAACPAVQEAATLSTCNRFELHLVSADRNAAIREVLAHLSARSGLDEGTLWGNLFMLSGEDAVWHLLRVSSGLDSLVVGEGQILSQVKACFSHATSKGGSAKKVLSRLLNVAVAAGKRVRAETSIAKGAVSISSAASELADMRAEEALGRPFDGASITIVGAGTMSRLLLTHLASKGVRRARLLNRGMERAEALAAQFPDVDVVCETMEALGDALATSDVVFTSTGATHCIVTREGLEGLSAREAGRRLMLVDISVPRNVEVECNAVDGVSAYNVDDLKAVVARNQASRRRSVLEAEALLEGELAAFMSWQRTLDYVPVIGKLQANAESIRAAELAKVSKKLGNLSAKEMEQVERCTKSIVNKLLHSPMAYLRQDQGKQLTTREIVEGLFDL